MDPLARIGDCLADLESRTKVLITRLLERQSEIEASGKLLADLHSQRLTLRSCAAELRAMLSNRPHAD